MHFYDVLIIPLPTPQAGIFGITDEFTLDKNILLNNSKEFDNNILLIFAYSREKTYAKQKYPTEQYSESKKAEENSKSNNEKKITAYYRKCQLIIFYLQKCRRVDCLWTVNFSNF